MSRPPQEEDKPCEWKDAVSIYVLGNLVGEDCIALERHLAGGCFQCELELSRAVESLETLAESAVTTLPSGARERFLTAFDKERLAQKKKPDSSILYKKSGVLISRSDAIPWQPVGIPGIWAKALFADVEQHCVTSLVRVDPRAQYPSHRHGGPEEIFLLSGDITIEGKLLKPGDYCHADPGSVHGESFSNSGCTFILRACERDEFLS